jgi:hypothetical protein
MIASLSVYRGTIKIMMSYVQKHPRQTALDARPLLFSSHAARRASSSNKDLRKSDVHSNERSSSNPSLRHKRMSSE